MDTDEDNILCALDEAEVTECAYLVSRHTRLMSDGESVEAPVPRDFGLLNAVQEAVLLTVAVFFFEQPEDDLGLRMRHLIDVLIYTIHGGNECEARASFGSLDETLPHPLQAICQHRSLARANISCFIDDS